jgi:WD40 repeat protein/tRNA A-37 threonylcarbamoyl transferase component Bud32
MKQDADVPQDSTMTSASCSETLGSPPPTEAAPGLRPRDAERYELIAEHGRGGLGRVIRARDRDLGRDVAIKEALSHSAAVQARFMREAMITARLEHPGIVPVHDAGRWPDGTPFYAMKLVAGRPLRQLIVEAQTPEARLALLPHIIAVADAMAYAHDRGIVHRDLKPSNIIVGEFGETLVIDWGLAKDLRATDADVVEGDEPAVASELTRAGMVLGTPSYMPVEQARSEPVDERADVYAIGAAVYHLLAGAAPYGGSQVDVLAKLLADAPAPLETVAPDVPPELAAIVRKAMARDRDDRYRDARTLAEDLRRFQTGQLVSVHDYSLRALVLRWLRRHRVPVTVGSIALFLLVAVGVVAVRGIVASRREAQTERAIAVRGRQEAEERANQLILTQARNSLDRDPTASIAWLEQYPDDGKNLEEARWIAADAVSRGVAGLVLSGHHGYVVRAAFLADGTAVTAATNDVIRFWDLSTGTVVRELPADITVYMNLLTSDDGRRVSYREDMRTTVVVGLGDAPPQRFEDCSHPPLATWFSANGKKIACTDAHKQLRIVDVDSGVATRVASWGTAEMSALGLSASGEQVAVAYLDGSILLTDLRDGSRRELAPARAQVAERIDLSADGHLLVAANFDGSLEAWRVGERAHERLSDPGVGSRAYALSRDGHSLAYVTSDGQVEVRSTVSAERRTLPIDGRAVYTMELSRDGQLLAIGSIDAPAQIWRLDSQEHWSLRGQRAGVGVVTFSADSRQLITGAFDRTARLWAVPQPTSRLLWKDVFGHFNLDRSNDGERVVSDGQDGYLHVYDTGTATVRRVPTQPITTLVSVAIRADHLRVIAGGVDGTVRVFDEPFAKPEIRLPVGVAEIRAVAFASSGEYFAAAGPDGLRVWRDAPSPVLVYERHDAALGVRFRSTDDLVAVALQDGAVLLVDPASLAARRLEGHRDAVTALAFSADGSQLVSGSLDATVRLWEVASGNSRVLPGTRQRIEAVAFSPDGETIAAGGQDGDVCVWTRALRWDQARHLRGHTGAVRRLAFAGDGRHLVTASGDGTSWAWALAEGAASVPYLGEWPHAGEINGLTLLPDGDTVVVSDDTNGYVRQWKLSQLTYPPSGVREFRAWLDARTNCLAPSTER